MAGRMCVPFLKNGGLELFCYCISVGITESAVSVGLMHYSATVYTDVVIGIVREMPFSA